ncbi:small integral membrane protein 14-like [Asterias rubens]|uniref:small integral membrane protein 14-like n=1 Tax=Asterias rubens TaxID=7604 RepID=UPI001455225A|nr:small integral membrane protein 14-like [Asterias rubens]
MAEGGYDPCECVCSHEGAMRRLLSMLRDSQQTCSDSQCDLEFPGTNGGSDGFNYSMFMMMVGWIVLVVVLYLFRPASIRGNGDQKPRPGNQDPGPSPRAPPLD